MCGGRGDNGGEEMKKGFSVIELLVVISVISFALASVFTVIKAVENWEKISLTKKVVKALNDAVEMTFRSNARFVSSGCYGFNDGVCTAVTLTPLVVDNTTLQFNTYDADVIALLRSAGCRIEGELPNFTVVCFDGFGRPLRFSSRNEHNFGEPYTAPYEGNFYSLTIYDSIGNTYSVSLRRLEEFFVDLSREKLSVIAGAVEEYVAQKRRLELVNVCGNNGTSEFDPPGGLGSWDDSEVPWIWQALGTNPLALCSGVEDNATGCGCSDFNTEIWRDDENWCVLDSPDEIALFLRNINLDPSYKTDAFGNAIEIVPIADGNGLPLEGACPPPKPKPYYPLAVVTKTRIGVRDLNGNWVFYVDVTGQ